MSRRSLLTAGGLAPFVVGAPSFVATSSTAAPNYIGLSRSVPAVRAGTVTSINAEFATGGTVYFVTCSLAGTTVTPKAISGSFAIVSAGLQTFTVSLPILTGEYVGVFLAASPPNIGIQSSAVDAGYVIASIGGAPVMGTPYAGSVAGATDILCVNGTAT